MIRSTAPLSSVFVLVGLLAHVAAPAATSLAAEIGFVEDFALADDRERALEQLIPGTRDHYYYSCLHYQNRGDLDKVDAILKAWIQRHKRTGRVPEIENRQALLRYSDDPRRTLEFLRKRLSLRFDHRRDVAGEGPQLPSRLDRTLISRESLTRRALERHGDTMAGFESRALGWASGLQLSPERRRRLLGRLTRPDIPGLAQLVVDDLKHRHSGGFGSHRIHARLLLDQLDECLRLRPELRNESRFVSVYLKKLWPNPDVDWRRDAEAREQYLERLWSFVSTLGDAHNSLKAHTLYHRLAHDQSLGVYDKERFHGYLRLPREAPYIEPRFMRRADHRKYAANLGSDFESATLFPPVGIDEPLVAAYFGHFFLTEATWEPYTEYVRDEYLKRRFAETKILAGVGDMERWYSLLPPTEYQALKERVDIDFAPTNKVVFSPGEQVALDVWVKNVRTLIVKVFEINLSNYYRTTGRELDTAIDLDGLVANEGDTYTYDEPALRRVKRHFEFPFLKPRGVYVIDFIGNGQSSRALVRRGQLRFLVRDSVAGHVFTVLDEARRRLPDAGLWLSGKSYEAGEDGRITVPYSNEPGRRSLILEHSDFAALHSFRHDAEQYALTAGIHCEREALVQRKQATVVVRPSLTVNGTPVTLSVLEEVTLTLTTTDGDGVITSKEIKDFKLFEDRESTYEFQVPPNLARLHVELRAKVEALSQGKRIDLAAEWAFSLNGINATEKIEDVHLALAEGGYVLDVLGKSGEVLENRPVRLTVKHRDFRDTVQVSLQSDVVGRIELGELPGVDWIAARDRHGVDHEWQLPEDRTSLPPALHGRVGGTLLVPYMGRADTPSREDVSLLEVRGDTFTRDRFGALTHGGGFLRIEGLPRGNYDLYLKRYGKRIPVRISAGEGREGHVLSPYRQLEVRYQRPLQIDGVKTEGDGVAIQLRNTTKFTRVHVAATRFLPEYSIYRDLDAVPTVAPVRKLVTPAETLYVVGRDIGEEYRYVLERKYATKLPGNMLKRPGILLNPWAIRETSTELRRARAGENFDLKTATTGTDGLIGLESGALEGESSSGGFANVDFLASATPLLTNLRPDENGVVRVSRSALGSGQHLHVFAVDPEHSVYRHRVLGGTASDFADLRLRGGLDPRKHFTQQKSVTVVKKDARFVLDDITTSEFEVYDSLDKIHALFVTLSGDAHLRSFRFILDWPTLSAEEKRTRYSEFACHELNFFLSKKDPEFFKGVVQPYLQNKYHKSFLDHLLLGDDLSRFVEPWEYARLNVVERILLSQRVAAERPYTRRHIEDSFDLVPPDADRVHVLFQTALRGRALELGDAYGIEGELEAVGRASEADLKRLPSLHPGRERAAAAGARSKVAAAADEEAPASRSMPEEAGAPGKIAESLEFFAEDLAKRGSLRQLFRRLDRTQEWVENNYYRLPIEQQNAALITVNAFWRDFARFDGNGPFFSSHLAEATRNFAEMMFALTVLDLPFRADEHKSEIVERSFVLNAASPLVVYHKEIRPAEASKTDVPILVSQNFYRHGERYRQVGNERVDKYVTGEFLVHIVYGSHVVVTNPTSSRQKLSVLVQIPEGAIGVLKGQATRSVDVVLEPYRTWTHDSLFYFPATGSYGHFPVHVARDGQLVAFAPPTAFTVVSEPSTVDRESWEYVSQRGSADDVLALLGERNLGTIDLGRVAWRMQDRDFFVAATELLSKRHAYHGTLWSYGILHDSPTATREFLKHADGFVRRCGDALVSALLTIEPVERRSYQHMEYRPLVNARAHRLGKRREILNDRFHAQYERFLKILTYHPTLDDEDLLGVTYYLTLQDRIEDSFRFFDRIRPQRLASKIQYDAVAAYVDLSRDNLRRVREVASRYAEYPVNRWRQFFTSVTAQVDEVEVARAPEVVDPKDRTQIQTQLAAMEPSFDFAVEGKRVVLTHKNLERCQVNFYLMDLELLFSRNPLVQEHTGQFGFIQPNHSAEIPLGDSSGTRELDIPERFRSTNVLVEVLGGGVRKSRPYFANALAVDVSENYAHLRVAARDTGRVLPRVYVKVYARMHDGRVRFYKDGYTDLRGRFDYGSLSTNELENVQMFSILVFSEERGALVREARPPQL